MILKHNSPNNLSQRAVLAPKPGALGPGRAVPMIQLRDADDRDAQNLNVILMPATVDALAQAEHGPCVAILDWGTGSAGVTAEVDFAKGTVLQLSASFLSISGRNDGNLPDGAGGTLDPRPGPQTVVAMVSGYGGRVAFGRATRTFHRASLPPGGAFDTPVPNFAKGVVVHRTPAGIAVVAETFDAFPPPQVEFPPPPRPRMAISHTDAMPLRFDLIDLAGRVRIVNAGPVALESLQVVYELCL